MTSEWNCFVVWKFQWFCDVGALLRWRYVLNSEFRSYSAICHYTQVETDKYMGKVYIKLPQKFVCKSISLYIGCIKRIWYLSPKWAAKVQASLRIRAVSPEPPLLTHTSSESRGTFRQKARSLAPLNGWACAVKICHDGMLEDQICLKRSIWYKRLAGGRETITNSERKR